jgi:hypothetical protein
MGLGPSLLLPQAASRSTIEMARHVTGATVAQVLAAR